MSASKLYKKIASQVYTYMINQAGQDEEQNKIELEDIKSDIINKRDIQASKKIQELAESQYSYELKKFINSKDNKGYTLLMLAASNNLIETVKNLVIYGADTSITLPLKGSLFKKMVNFKFKHDLISEEEYNDCLLQKQYDALAIDIAQLKGYTAIVNVLK